MEGRLDGGSNRPVPRDSLGLVSGYHSPQVDVEVRLNTNEAPDAPPAKFVADLADAVSDIAWNRYPERSASELRRRIAESEQPNVQLRLDKSNVVVANGSNEVLQAVCLTYGGPGRRVVTIEPTYQLHSHIARIAGTDVVEVERNNDFTIDLEALGEAVEAQRPSVIFVCSPNNPTGLAESESTVRQVLDFAEQVGALLVVDEAYGQFAPWSALSLVEEDRSILVSRTFSKTWSSAGLRLGYAIGARWVIAAMEKVLLPYHIDAIKQVAGCLALDHQAEMERRVAALVEERGRIVAALSPMPLDLWPSDSNFVLFRPRSGGGDQLWQSLLDASVLVRNCSSWPRLDDCLRVTVGTPEENTRFIEALSDALAR